MNYRVLTYPQRSPEWRDARLGRLTGSRAVHALDFNRDGKESAKRRDYRIQLVAERLTGIPCDSDFVNADMQRGIELEPEAVAAYEAHTGNLAQPVGFLQHTTLLAGYSPDANVNDGEGWVEVKCPRPANHIGYLRASVLPREHLAQCRHALWLTGAEWIDFVSYSPALPDALRLFVVRLTRAQANIDGYGDAARAFLDECELEYDALATQANLRERLEAAV